MTPSRRELMQLFKRIENTADEMKDYAYNNLGEHYIDTPMVLRWVRTIRKQSVALLKIADALDDRAMEGPA